VKKRVAETSVAVYHSEELRRLATTERGLVKFELAKRADMTILELAIALDLPSGTISARLDEICRDREVFRDIVNKRPCRINGIRKITFRLSTPVDLVQTSLWGTKGKLTCTHSASYAIVCLEHPAVCHWCPDCSTHCVDPEPGFSASPDSTSAGPSSTTEEPAAPGVVSSTTAGPPAPRSPTKGDAAPRGDR
jgi:hypothetical protein